MMRDFELWLNTRFLFGRDVHKKAGSVLRQMGVSRVLIHHDSGAYLYDTGLLESVRRDLEDNGMAVRELPGVKPNPRLDLVYEGIRCVKENQIDFILAIGGGSVIDSSKAIGAGALYDGDVWDLYAKTAEPQGAVGVGVVLTIPAAGSESSNSSVLTNEEEGLKRSCDSDDIYPKFSILNPELTYSMPKYQIACGSVDIMAHIMERYFTQTMHNSVSDRMAEALLRNMIEFAPKALEEPLNYDYRAEVMWNGTLAHNNLINCGRQADGASHPIEHELSTEYDMAHGGGLAIVYPAFMKYVYKQRLSQFIRFATAVWNVEYDRNDPAATAYEGIVRLERFFRSLGLPTTLEDAGLDYDDAKLRFLAERCDRNELGKVGHFVELETDDVEKIYHLAKKEG